MNRDFCETRSKESLLAVGYVTATAAKFCCLA